MGENDAKKYGFAAEKSQRLSKIHAAYVSKKPNLIVHPFLTQSYPNLFGAERFFVGRTHLLIPGVD